MDDLANAVSDVTYAVSDQLTEQVSTIINKVQDEEDGEPAGTQESNHSATAPEGRSGSKSAGDGGEAVYTPSQLEWEWKDGCWRVKKTEDELAAEERRRTEEVELREKREQRRKERKQKQLEKEAKSQQTKEEEEREMTDGGDQREPSQAPDVENGSCLSKERKLNEEEEKEKEEAKEKHPKEGNDEAEISKAKKKKSEKKKEKEGKKASKMLSNMEKKKGKDKRKSKKDNRG